MIKANTSLDMHEVLGSEGIVCKSFDGFESRLEQIRMADYVQDALIKGCHLAVEAGTGVGKSFAYLIPAIEAVGRKSGKVLVSTYTITLQEQLINKDLPFLTECMPQPFTAILAKGRSNYLCKRRLEYAIRKKQLLMDRFSSELLSINDWAGRTKDGSLSDISFIPSNAVWDAVKSEHGNCRGRRCPCFQDCFYKRARRQLDNADIIVANHALMFSDLVLKEDEVPLLPKYSYVIIDEAHNIERVAESHFGINISNHTVKYLLDNLYNPVTKRGLLAYTKSEGIIELIGKLTKATTRFFRQIRGWYEEAKDENGGRCYKNFVDEIISEDLKKLRSELSRLANKTEDIDDKFEILRFVNKCAVLIQDLECFFGQKKNGYVYWVEVKDGRRASTRLRSAAVNVGADVKRCLFDKYESIILTSATLSCGQGDEKSGFDFFADRIGLEDFDAVKLGSPFDYAKQVTVYIEKDMPNPNDKAFIGAATEAIKKYILQTQGRTFVLFTSYSMLNNAAEDISGWLTGNGFELLQQGAGVNRSEILRQFKSKENCVLFGTDSFWQGVDIPGQALSNVIIVKLPFAVPDQPLLAGRLEQIKNEGGNPFFDYQLPSAIIKFKQGFGRLIRSKSDKGIVVILDSRIIQKRYGQRFLAAIPKCQMEIVGKGK